MDAKQLQWLRTQNTASPVPAVTQLLDYVDELHAEAKKRKLQIEGLQSEIDSLSVRVSELETQCDWMD